MGCTSSKSAAADTTTNDPKRLQAVASTPETAVDVVPRDVSQSERKSVNGANDSSESVTGIDPVSPDTVLPPSPPEVRHDAPSPASNTAVAESSESNTNICIDEFVYDTALEGISASDADSIRLARACSVQYLNLPPSLFTNLHRELKEVQPLNLKWELKIDKEKEKVRVYTSEVPGSPWVSCKAEITIPADRDDVFAVVSNDYRLNEFDNMTGEIKVLREVGPRCLIRRIESVSLWPVSKRDFVSLTIWDELDDGSLIACTRGVTDETGPPVLNIVRGTLNFGCYLVRPIRRKSSAVGAPPPESILTLVAHSDLGGAIPSSIVNMLATQTPYKFCTLIAGASVKPNLRAQLTGPARVLDDQLQELIIQEAEHNVSVKQKALGITTQRVSHAPRASVTFHPSTVTGGPHNLIKVNRESTDLDLRPSSVVGGPTERDLRYSTIIQENTNQVEPRLFCGNMRKVGQVVKSIKQRYFILEKGILKYFTDEADMTIRGELDLQGYKVLQPSPLSILLSSAVNISDSVLVSSNHQDGVDASAIEIPAITSRELRLWVDDEEDMDHWMQSFREHIAYRNRDACPETCTGYMRKQGRFIKNWKDRYFVLDRGTLYYYDSSITNAPRTKGDRPSISLTAVGESMYLDHATITESPPSGLVVVSQGSFPRTLRLECVDATDMRRWLQALRNHASFNARKTDGLVKS